MITFKQFCIEDEELELVEEAEELDERAPVRSKTVDRKGRIRIKFKCPPGYTGGGKGKGSSKNNCTKKGKGTKGGRTSAERKLSARKSVRKRKAHDPRGKSHKRAGKALVKRKKLNIRGPFSKR